MVRDGIGHDHVANGSLFYCTYIIIDYLRRLIDS